MSLKIIRRLNDYKPANSERTVVTIGTFDGIHLGHQEIFKRVMTQAKNSGLDPVIVTFDPHPRMLVTPDNVPLLLTTPEEKLAMLAESFNGTVIILKFTRELMKQPAEYFIREIIVDTLKARKLIVGYDHALGKNRGGNVVELTRFGKKYDYEVEVVGPIMVGDAPASSSRIRKSLKEGRFPEALKLLGHEFHISGRVQKGIGLGRKIGYPTANINYSPRKLLPMEGVYSCRVKIDDDIYEGMMFIGRSKFNPNNLVTVEANIFDFDQDIYDKEITTIPLHFIRENRTYKSPELLVEQIRKDKIDVINILKKEKKDASDKGAKSSNYC